jgi:hypothetical protein
MDTLFEGEPIVVDGAGNVIGGQSRVCFDVPCEPNKPYDPSEFGGVKLVDSHTNVPPVPHRGLDRMKRLVPLFDADLGVFDGWYAKIETMLGTYCLGNPRRIERDLKPGAEYIKLCFGKLPVTKHAYLKRLTVYNETGVVIGFQTWEGWAHPGDTLFCTYTLNV